jgi:phage-related protein
MSTKVGEGYIEIKPDFDNKAATRMAELAGRNMSRSFTKNFSENVNRDVGGSFRNAFAGVARDVDRTTDTIHKRYKVKVDRDSQGWGRNLARNLTQGFESIASILPARLEGVFSKTGPLLGTVLAAGVAGGIALAAPSIGAALTGAIFLTGGLAAAVAAAFVGAAHDPRVNQAATRLKDKFVAKIVDDPSVAQLGGILAAQLDKVTKALDAWAPHIQNILNAGAKFLNPITNAAIQGLTLLIVSLDKLSNSKFMEGLVKVFSSGMVKIMGAIATSIDRMLKDPKAMEGATKGLELFMNLIAGTIMTIFDFLRWLSRMYDSMSAKGGAFDKIRKTWKTIKDIIDAVVSWYIKYIKTIVDWVKTAVQKFLEWNDAGKKLVKLWSGTILPFLQHLGAVIMNTARAIVGFIVTVAQNIWNWLVAFWQRNGAKIMSILASIFNTVVNTIQSIIGGIPGVIDGIKNAFVNVYNAVKGAIDRFLAWNDTGKKFVDLWNNSIWPALKAFGDFMVTLGQKLWQAALIIGGILYTVARIILGVIFTVIKWVWDIILSVWRTAGQTILNHLAGIWNAIFGILKGAFQIIQGVFTFFSGLLTLNWSKMWTGIKLILSGSWAVLINILKLGWRLLQLLWTVFVNLLKALWDWLWGKIKEAAKAAWNFLIAYVKNQWNSFVAFLRNALNGFVAFWVMIWNKVWSWIVSIWNKIRTAVVNGWNTIHTWLVNKLNAIKKTWSDIWTGIWTFVGGIWNKIQDAVRSGINGVIDIINKGIGFINAVLGKLGVSFKIPLIAHVGGGGGLSAGGASLSSGKVNTSTLSGIKNASHRASGGRMYGPGSNTSDSIPTMLSKDEYVLRARAAKAIGFSNLDNLNRNGHRLGARGYAGGGRVGAGNNALLDHHRNHLHIAMAGPNMSWPQIVVAAKKSGIPYSVGSNYRPGSVAEGGGLDHHSEGRAVDFPGFNQDALASYFLTVPGVIEEIHRTATRDYAIFGGKGDRSGGIVTGIMKFLGKGMGWITKNMLGPAKDKALSLIPGGTAIGELAKGSVGKMFEGVVAKVKGEFDSAQAAMSADTGAGGGGSDLSGGGAARWSGVASAALKMLGLPSSWLPPLLRLIDRESGGNPRSINLTDSNAKAGHPSKGLMQTIGPTFDAYKVPGHGDIYDPLSNILAGLRYINSRYRTIFNVQQAVGATPHGYDNGGWMQPGWNYSGLRGPEMALNTAQGAALEKSIAGLGSGGTTVKVYVDGVEVAHKAVVEDNNAELIRSLRTGSN